MKYVSNKKEGKTWLFDHISEIQKLRIYEIPNPTTNSGDARLIEEFSVKDESAAQKRIERWLSGD
jgi:hypothetical protein